MLSLSPCFFIFNIFNALSLRLLWNALIRVAFCIVTPFYIVCNSREASLVPLSGSLGETNVLGWKKRGEIKYWAKLEKREGSAQGIMH